MDKLLPPTIRNTDEYHEASWDTRDITYKEDIINKAIKNGLPAVMQKEVKGEFYDNYCTIPP